MLAARAAVPAELSRFRFHGDAFLRDMVGHYYRTRIDVMAGVDEAIGGDCVRTRW